MLGAGVTYTRSGFIRGAREKAGPSVLRGRQLEAKLSTTKMFIPETLLANLCFVYLDFFYFFLYRVTYPSLCVCTL